ncbi:MAG: hypothetical protein EBT12_09000 [Marivivens sp.]|mgnify:CR=1 FL=1|nr:hypothetical protein [Marivivens sp.]
MRDFFINTAEKLIGVFVIVAGIILVVAAIPMIMMMPGMQGGDVFAGLLFLVIGAAYVILAGGLVYVVFGLYRNTQKTNQLLEELLKKP